MSLISAYGSLLYLFQVGYGFISLKVMTRTTYNISRFNKLAGECFFSSPTFFLMILSISLLCCFIFLGPQKQNRAMFSAYSDFPITFLEHSFVCPELRILLYFSY